MSVGGTRSAGVAAPPRRVPGAVGGLLALAALAGVALLSTVVGPVAIPPATVLEIVVRSAAGSASSTSACGAGVSANQCAIWIEIVWGARVPGVLLALLAGAALGISGGTLQGIFRNPLADPYLLGLSAGAALGASSLYTFGWFAAERGVALPIVAFLGGLLPGSAVYLAARSGRRSPETLLLTGVALNALFSSILSSFLLYNPTGNVSLSFWLLGGLGGATWNDDGLLFGVVLVLGSVIALAGSEVNLLQLGPDVAQSLGVDARGLTRRLVLLTTFLTAAAVAFTGIVGFVGLIAPHLVRRLVGVDYRRVLPWAAVGGGLFLLLAWDVAQSVIPEVVVPVGIPTAFSGAVFFLYLLYGRTFRRSVGGTA